MNTKASIQHEKPIPEKKKDKEITKDEPGGINVAVISDIVIVLVPRCDANVVVAYVR